MLTLLARSPAPPHQYIKPILLFLSISLKQKKEENNGLVRFLFHPFRLLTHRWFSRFLQHHHHHHRHPPPLSSAAKLSINLPRSQFLPQFPFRSGKPTTMFKFLPWYDPINTLIYGCHKTVFTFYFYVFNFYVIN